MGSWILPLKFGAGSGRYCLTVWLSHPLLSVSYWRISPELVEGGKTITRQVDLSCMPIYVRAGAIIPFDPVRQYTSQEVDKPTTLRIYQGADGQYTLYDDDGVSLDYLKGTSIKTLIQWDDKARRLTIAPQSRHGRTAYRMPKRKFSIEHIPSGATKEVLYTGRRLELGM